MDQSHLHHRRRAHDRFRVELPARLVSIEKNPVQRAAVVHDLSLGGALVWVDEPIAVGTVWKLQIEGACAGNFAGALLARTCRPSDPGPYVVGFQYVVDPALLESFGVGGDRMDHELAALIAKGTRPNWDFGYHIVAAEPMTVHRLAAARVSARRDLTVTHSAIDCTLDVSGHLIAPGAVIAGGSSHVLQGVRVGELGANDGSPTRMTLGRSLSTSTMLAAAETELAARRARITADMAAIAELQKHDPSTLSHADRERLTVLMSDIDELQHRVSRMESNVDILRSRETLLRDARLEITLAIHPGASIQCGSAQVTFERRVEGPLTIGLVGTHELAILEPPASNRDLKLEQCASVHRSAA